VPDEEFEVFEEKEMRDTGIMFRKENSMEYNKVDKKIVALQYSDSMADAMLFQSAG
jgi:hypothetical protein